MQISKMYDLGGKYADPALPPLFGVECEMESVRRDAFDVSGMWDLHDDGSLRNHGAEYVSKPYPLETTLLAFQTLHSRVKTYRTDQKFSSRTSIHVHVNCQQLDEKQVRNIVLMYALFEPIFFELVEPGRKDNIHCVPLSETYLPTYYSQPLDALRRRWSKYTALNLLPITTLGTIEFRHMQGHDDVGVFTQWLRTINNLFVCGLDTPITPEFLTGDGVVKAFREIFGHLPQYPALATNLEEKIGNTLLDVKLGMI